ncbi:MAG TPA: hypothetical protein DCM05_06525 [Elusimicrobia bacterium]|nr:hypothetical protein [Elusimicrobiota bacterium]
MKKHRSTPRLPLDRFINARCWEDLESLLPDKRQPWRRRERRGGRPARPSRLCLEALLWHLRSGLPWRSLPKRFGSARTIQRRIRRWGADGSLSLAWRRYLERADDKELEAWLKALPDRPGKKRGWWYWELFGLLSSLAGPLKGRPTGLLPRARTMICSPR